MKDFVKYLAWTLFALAVSLALPGLPLAWPALVWTAAYTGSARKGSAWCLLPVLSLLFAAFSLASPWEFALPLATAGLGQAVLRRNFALHPAARRGLLLLGCLAGQFLLGAALAAWRGSGWIWTATDLIWALASCFSGLVLFPILGWALARAAIRLTALGRSARQVDLSRADWFGGHGGRLARKPFGLEKGL